MILLDHALAGAAIFYASGSGEPHVLAATVIGSLLPDADLSHGRPGSIGYLKHHRTYTHSLLVAPALAIPIAWIITLLVPQQGIVEAWLWVLAGVGGHLAMDWINSFGTMLLYPFSRRRCALDLIFEFDLAVSGILAATIAIAASASQAGPALARQAGVLCGLAFLGYVGYRWLRRRGFRRRVWQYVDGAGIDHNSIEAVSIVPALYWRWKGIVATPKAHHVIIDGRDPEICPRSEIPPELQTPETAVYSAYARHLDVQHEGSRLVLSNLAYSPSTYRMTLDYSADEEPTCEISLPRLGPQDL